MGSKSDLYWRIVNGNSHNKRIIKTKIERNEESNKAYYQPNEKRTYKQRGIAPPFNFCSINIKNDIK